MPVDFEVGGAWREQLAAAGFDADKPAVLASTGVSTYLTHDANVGMLREVAAYAGKKPKIVDPKTGERIEVELFVAVMGASNYTYAEVTATQQSADWIASHNRLVEYLGGAPGAFVPDQLKSGVTTASRYESAIQRTYEEWSQHYSTTIVPARPASPRDKAKVEGGVLIAERWILGRVRNLTCFSIDELNEQIRALLVDLNSRVMKRYGKEPQQLFDELDRPVLAPQEFAPNTLIHVAPVDGSLSR